MHGARGAERYRQTAIETASPGRRLLMLYDGAISFLTGAAKAMEAGAVAEKARLVARAAAIVAELRATLRPDVHAELCENLVELYSFANAELVRANLQNDAAGLRKVAELLGGLRDAWDQAIRAAEGREPRRTVG